VPMLFVDFFSAFNTIIPQHLISKLDLSTPLCNCLPDFLTNRPQYVWVEKNNANVISLTTGSPQGYVLSPLLFTLMTHDCRARSPTNHIVKPADDTTVVSLIQDNNDLALQSGREPPGGLVCDKQPDPECLKDKRNPRRLQEDMAKPHTTPHQ